MTDTYRVVAPYVMVKVSTVNGVEVKGLYASSLLPEGTLPESIEQHLRKRFQGRPMIEKVGVASAPATAPVPVVVEVKTPEPAPVPVPDTVPDPEIKQPTRPSPPPASGAGSGQKAWIDYAIALGYERADVEKMTRDELVALTGEGKPGG